MLGFSRKQRLGQQSAEEKNFGQRHFHFPRAGTEFPGHFGIEVNELKLLSCTSVMRRRALWRFSSRMAYSSAGRACHEKAFCCGVREATAQFVLENV